MKKRIFNLLIITFLFQFSIMAQSLETHLWQNRVVILFAPDLQDIALQKQISLFEKNLNGLKERKLVVYQITPNTIKKDSVEIFESSFKDRVLEKYKLKNNEFTFILIGLDGGEKLRSIKEVSLEELFGKIDQMPMRKAEINH